MGESSCIVHAFTASYVIHSVVGKDTVCNSRQRPTFPSTSRSFPSSDICHTKPISDLIGPPDASLHGIHAAPAGTPPTPSPLHTASARDKVPGSAPAGQ